MVGTTGPLLRIIRDQRVAFLAVGGVNTAVGAAFFIGWEILLGKRVGYLVVLVLAHICAVLCAFVLYRRLVFRVRGHVLRDLARFELVNLTSLAVNAALLPVAVELLHMSPIAGQLAITVLTVAISFFGHRDFSFRRSRPLTLPVDQPGDEQARKFPS